MLVNDFRQIGNKLYEIRKHMGMTQAEVAEAAELSDRTYADIERGNVNMRIETIMKICKALNITPDRILTEPQENLTDSKKLFEKLEDCSPKEKETALKMLSIYIESLR